MSEQSKAAKVAFSSTAFQVYEWEELSESEIAVSAEVKSADDNAKPKPGKDESGARYDSIVLKRLLDQAWQKGYEQGHNEVAAERRKTLGEIQTKIEQLDLLGNKLRTKQAELANEQSNFFATELIPLASSIAERFLSKKSEMIFPEMAAIAVQIVAEWEPSRVQLTVSTEDVMRWRNKAHLIAEHLTDPAEFSLKTDENLSPGDWLLDTDVGGIISNRKDQLRRIEEELAEVLESSAVS